MMTGATANGRDPAEESRPNIVVIVLDSVRYDRTTLGGHDRNTTPNLRRIARRPDGRSFGTAISHARYTLPSSASMLTGVHPGEHGLGFGTTLLDNDVPTVAEAFSEAGYTTALVSDNHFVSEETGLARGFDTSTLLPTSPGALLETVGVTPVLRWLANIRRHSAGFETDKYRHSQAYLTTSLVEQRLDALEDQSDPFFLYAHYNQTHRPYYPPLAWFDRFDAYEMSRSDAGDFAMEVHNNLVEKVANGCRFTDDEWTALRALYDAQLAYTDEFVGDLFDRVRRQSGETVVVVTADHGEHFGEHGALGHKYMLDDPLLRVPLVTSGLPVEPDGSPVQHSDVMRTLLSLADARAEFVDGVDLRETTPDYAVTQDGERSMDPLFEHNPEFDLSTFFPNATRSLPQRTTVRTPEYRYVRGADGSSVLYRSPDERCDISDEATDVVAELDETLDEWQADHRRINHDERADDTLSQTTRDRLMEMGYLEEEL